MTPDTRSFPQAELPGVRRWAVLFLIYAAVAAGIFGYKYLDDLARQSAGTFLPRVIEETTGGFTSFLLLPAVLCFSRTYLFRPMHWFRRTMCHFLGAAVFSVAHTTLAAFSRRMLFPLFGLGSYDYGVIFYRYPMEFSNDLLGYTVIILLYYFVERYRLSHAQQVYAAELQTKLARAQLENLRLQVHPHFLFNTLNTISSVMYEDVRVADEMLTKLSEMLRLTLRSSRLSEIPLAEELKITCLYLDLMRWRFENKLQVHYAIDPETNQCLVPQLILQPLLENSLKHGMKSDGTALEIHLGAHLQDVSLVMRVRDNGVGYHKSALTREGLGLDNVQGRLVQLYGDAHEFSIVNRGEGGTDVRIRIPLRQSLPEKSELA